MGSTYKVEISQVARDQMYNHVSFLSNVSEEASLTLKNAFIDNIKSLKSHPDRFSFYDNFALPFERYRKMPVVPYYLVLYEVTNKVVYVDYIIDTRQKNDTFIP
jgi:hypothetical protein